MYVFNHVGAYNVPRTRCFLSLLALQILSQAPQDEPCVLWTKACVERALGLTEPAFITLRWIVNEILVKQIGRSTFVHAARLGKRSLSFFTVPTLKSVVSRVTKEA
eukprot:1157168-Pelagomonas_calceolata.AAC.2